ncbi:MAG: TRAP transporter substrate-binding protein [Alphaproteobacteria bacterium]|nr:TRAP transporter substrate-binding protein [Alphaproteobacteria bacterium]
MRRRRFAKGAAVGTAAMAAASVIGAPAISQNRIEWRMVTSWPKLFPGGGTGAVRFAEKIEKATNGRLTIKVFAAGELVPAFEAFDAVQRGTADCMNSASYYWQNKAKVLSVFTTLPFGMTNYETVAWMRHGGGQELWDEVYAKFGLKGFHSSSTGVQMAGWFNKEIKSSADFNGLKMRIPGLGGEALRKLGATIVNLPVGEIFGALQSGAIDATEWVGPWQDLAAGFYKVAKYYYWPGMHEPAVLAETSVNKAKFEALPKDVQQIFAYVCSEEYLQQSSEADASNAGALATLITQHKVQLKHLPEEFLKAYGKGWNEVLTELRDTGDELTKKVLDSYYKFQREQMSWSRIGMQEYLNARLVGFKFN